MILFLLLLVVVIGLAVAGGLLRAFFYLWIIGAAILVADLIFLGAWLNMRRRRPPR